MEGEPRFQHIDPRTQHALNVFAVIRAIEMNPPTDNDNGLLAELALLYTSLNYLPPILNMNTYRTEINALFPSPSRHNNLVALGSNHARLLFSNPPSPSILTSLKPHPRYYLNPDRIPNIQSSLSDRSSYFRECIRRMFSTVPPAVLDPIIKDISPESLYTHLVTRAYYQACVSPTEPKTRPPETLFNNWHPEIDTIRHDPEPKARQQAYAKLRASERLYASFRESLKESYDSARSPWESMPQEAILEQIVAASKFLSITDPVHRIPAHDFLYKPNNFQPSMVNFPPGFHNFLTRLGIDVGVIDIQYNRPFKTGNIAYIDGKIVPSVKLTEAPESPLTFMAVFELVHELGHAVAATLEAKLYESPNFNPTIFREIPSTLLSLMYFSPDLNPQLSQGDTKWEEMAKRNMDEDTISTSQLAILHASLMPIVNLETKRRRVLSSDQASNVWKSWLEIYHNIEPDNDPDFSFIPIYGRHLSFDFLYLESYVVGSCIASMAMEEIVYQAKNLGIDNPKFKSWFRGFFTRIAAPGHQASLEYYQAIFGQPLPILSHIQQSASRISV